MLVEGRYKIRPGLYAAARFDHLGFSKVTGTPDRRVGRAGDARRSRRRLFAAAQSAAQGVVPAQYAGTAAARPI